MTRTKLSLKEKEAREADKAAKTAQKAAEKAKVQQDKEAQRQQEKEAQRQQRERERAEREAERRKKEEERQLREAEREGIRRETERLRLERERLKLEKEKEKLGRVLDRDKEKTEKEREKRSRQSEKDRQGKAEDRSRSLMSSFLGVALPASNSREALDEPAGGGGAAGDASTASAATAGASSSPSATSASNSSACSPNTAAASSSSSSLSPDAVLPVFHPFQPKPCSVMAALHRVPPANDDEIAVMDAAVLGITRSPSPDLSRVAARYRCPLPSHSASSLSSFRLHRRRRLFSFPPRRLLSRRLKLLQFHTSYRPAWFGFWPSSCLLSVPPWSQLRRDARLNYEVDSDDEWGEEPEGEELASEGDDDEEGGDAAALSSSREGRMRADGYEEADGFMVPEEEDGAAGGVAGGLLLTDAKITRERGGKVRVIIRPVIIGPYREGDALTAEVKELLSCSWRADGPIDVVRKREQADVSKELTASRKRPASSAAPAGDEQAKLKKTRTDTPAAAMLAVSPARARESSAAAEAQQAVSGVFLPAVRKKEKKLIAPELTAGSSGGDSAIIVAAAAETSDAAAAAASGSSFVSEDASSGSSDLLSPPSACTAMETDALPASSPAGLAASGESSPPTPSVTALTVDCESAAVLPPSLPAPLAVSEAQAVMC